MVTFAQLCKYVRNRKPTKPNSPRLIKSPQKKATCLKVYTITPKKPNSAIRKIAKVKLSIAYKNINQKYFLVKNTNIYIYLKQINIVYL